MDGEDNETSANEQMVTDCSKISTAVVMAAKGDWHQVDTYMQSVCDQATEMAPSDLDADRKGFLCREFRSSLVHFMRGQHFLHRINLPMAEFCSGFYASAVTNAATRLVEQKQAARLHVDANAVALSAEKLKVQEEADARAREDEIRQAADKAKTRARDAAFAKEQAETEEAAQMLARAEQEEVLVADQTAGATNLTNSFVLSDAAGKVFDAVKASGVSHHLNATPSVSSNGSDTDLMDADAGTRMINLPNTTKGVDIIGKALEVSQHHALTRSQWQSIAGSILDEPSM